MRTIFRKQLLLYLGTLIISFTFLGTALSQAIRVYFTSQRIAYLTDSGRRIADALEGFGPYGVFDRIWLETQMQAMHQYLDTRMMVIINNDYEVIGGSAYLAAPEQPVYAKEFEPLMDGQIVAVQGNINNLFKESLLIVGYPHPQGTFAILIGSSMAELEGTIYDMYRITFSCLIVTAVITFVLIHLSSRTISKPLRQMNEAARVIADGDFDKRIPVASKDEVGQLADRFNIMAESLQEQEKIRRAFIANLSHDLRSPLTSMRGFLQAIQDNTVPPEKQPYYLDIVMDETERLIKLSNDLLNIQMAQDADMTLTFSVFDLNELIRKTVMRFEQRALDKGLKIICRFAHDTDSVCADAGMIQRALYNLLDNAVKFSPVQTGEVVIDTTVTESKIAVGIKDNGPGIPEHQRKRIFDRFYKGDPSRGADKKGSGLGLSIVREFIRAHGGCVTVESPPGGGSLFVFTLPLAKG